MASLSKRRYVALFIRYFLLFLAVPLVLLAMFFHHDFHASEQVKIQALQAQENFRIGEKVKLLDQIMNGPVDNVISLTADHKNLAAFQLKSAREKKEIIADSLKSVMSRNPEYMQARWLDPEGSEVVRINRDGRTLVQVPDSNLQKKSHRPYVTRALNLKENQVYISALDLNIEYGKIERPLQPTLRFCARIFLPDGSSPGIFVINFSARNILQELAVRHPGRVETHRFLINEEGEWLKGPEPELEWGSLLGRKADVADYAPRLWARIRVSPQGTDTDSHGMWTWETLRPGRSWMSTKIRENWVVLGLVPAAAIRDLRHQAMMTSLRRSMTIIPLLVLLCLIGAHVQVKRREATANLAQRIQNELEDKARSEFLANMSHEIRTPMNGVIGLVQVLEESSLTSYQMDLTRKIHKSSEALLNVLNDILDYSKIEAGQLALTSEPLSIDDIFQRLSDLFSVATAMKGVELFFSYGRAVPGVVHGDALRLTQILSNLVGNAVKFTGQGHIRVSVQVENWQSNLVCLHFAVEDTGIGISEKQMRRIFTPFVQADASTSREYGGSGLGLSICRHLVKMMHGKLDVKSAPGVGSTFSFTASFMALRTSTLVTNPKLEGKRVLIVDAHAGVSAELEQLLRYWGMETTSFSSAEPALSCALENRAVGTPFDFLIADSTTLAISQEKFFASLEGVFEDQRLVQPFAILLVSPYQGAELAQYPSASAILRKPLLAGVLRESLEHAGIDEKFLPKFALTRSGNKNLYERAEALHGARVLLVEDNLINQDVATSLLRKMGLLVEVANNGLEAVEMADKRCFDVILMDLQMPVMDGFDATKIIRDKPYGPSLPIIAMTAAVFSSDRESARIRGMDDHICKPIDVTILLETLMKHVRLPPMDHPACSVPAQEGSLPRASAESLPENLPGLDISSALQHLSGEKTQLLRVFRRFVRDYPDWEMNIRSAIAQQHFDEAERLAHMLKGAAGTIGAEILQGRVAVLEAELKSGSSESCDEVCLALSKMLDSLRHHLPKEQLPHSAMPVQPEAARTEIKQIADILNQHGVVREDMMLSLSRSLGVLAERTEMVQLLEQIDKFDYSGAISSLQALQALVEKAGNLNDGH